MTTLPLRHLNSHLFLELAEGLWMHDTGAPASFGDARTLRLASQEFDIAGDYMGLNAAKLSELVGIDCRGLLGADVLGCFDQIIDLPGGRLTLDSGELEHPGHAIELEEFMGIPIIPVTVAGETFCLFFDTGAQVSYLQDDVLDTFPSAGIMQDFYPGFGEFETPTHHVPITLGSLTETLRCGRLPGLFGMSLMMADAQGILGNAILHGRTAGYFPRRGMLCL
jgi:hypothetical protein